jgi:hypothetical protein
MENEIVVGKVMNKAFEVLNEIIAPTCDISSVFLADPYLADINTYTMGDEQLEEEIVEAIQKKYNLEERFYIDAYTPLALIGLIILDFGA